MIENAKEVRDDFSNFEKFYKSRSFNKVYDELQTGSSFILFVRGVRVERVNTSKDVIVNDGTKKIYTLSEDLPAYEIASIIVDIAKEDRFFVDRELYEEVSDAIREMILSSEEKVTSIRGVGLHWIPVTHEVVILSDDYFRAKLQDLISLECSIYEISCAIKNIELKRDNPEYAELEKRAQEKNKQFFDKLTALENSDALQEVNIIEHTKLKDGYSVMVLVDKQMSNFSLVTFKDEEVFKSSVRYYNNPSTLNALSWDYVECTVVP